MVDVKAHQWFIAVNALAHQTEKLAPDFVRNAFVDVGHVTVMRAPTNQVLEGRRGTGKTHLLSYLCDHINDAASDAREVAIYLDLRGIRAESGREELSPRSQAVLTFRLLLEALANRVRQLAQTLLWQNPVPTQRSPYEQRQASDSFRALEMLFLAVSNQTAFRLSESHRTVTKDEGGEEKAGRAASVSVGADCDSGPGLRAKVDVTDSSSAWKNRRVVTTSRTTGHDSFRGVRAALEEFLRVNDLERLFVVLDEWSSMPPASQPFLADAVKRTFFASPYFIVKIGALPFQTRLCRRATDDQLIGLELNGDVFVGMNLDDDLVYARNPPRTADFFTHLLHRHMHYSLSSTGGANPFADARQLRTAIFTDSAFENLLKFSQGNPRDFLTLFKKAYTQFRPSGRQRISIHEVDAAAKAFGAEKMQALSEEPSAHDLFKRIVQYVFHEKRTGAFLIATERAAHRDFRYLVHNRLLHVWDKAYSAPKHKGERFCVVSIDFCVVADHLRAPNYRHVLAQNLRLPLTPNDTQFNDQLQQERRSHDRLTSLEPPDKRAIRYVVLGQDILGAEENFVQCPNCMEEFPPSHAVYRKLRACPHCAEPISRPCPEGT